MRSLVGWLEFAGVELGNDNRVLTYLRRGLAGGQWQVQLRDPLLPEGDCGYTDIYEDPYEELCPFSPENLACFCAPTSEDSYVSPSYDPAPWYDAARPESGDFLGFQPTAIDIPPSLSHSVTPRARAGAVIGRMRRGHRVATVAGFLYATSPQGLSWGERWITDQLRGTEDSCAPDLLRILPACPDELDTDRFFRSMPEAGIVDGPDFSAVREIRGCMVEAVHFQIAGGRDRLQAPSETILDEPLTGLHYALLEGPPGLGDAAAIITILAGTVGTSVQGVHITAAVTSGDACPSAEANFADFTIDYIPRGGSAVIDSVARTVRVYDVDGSIYTTFDGLTFTGLWDWIEIGHGRQICITIDGTTATLNPGTTVTVEQVDLEA